MSDPASPWMSLARREPLLLGAPAPVLAAGGAGLAAAIGVAETVLQRRQIASWPLEIAALVVLLVAGAVAVRRASPFRAPFRLRSHALVLALVLGAFVLDEAAQLGRNSVVHDDWGLEVVPVFLLVLSTLRPPREVLAGGLIATAVIVGVVLALSPTILTAAPAAARAAVAATQVLPPALAAAALSRVTLRRLERRATAPQAPVDEVLLSVRQEAVARLEAEAVPLLTRIAGAGAVSDADATRAREIAAELRGALVAQLARGWLADAGFDVDDPDGYSERLTAEQRAALRTVFASLPLADFDRPGGIAASGQDLQARIVATLPVSHPPRRSRVAPLVPLLRAEFARAAVDAEEDRVVVSVEVALDPPLR